MSPPWASSDERLEIPELAEQRAGGRRGVARALGSAGVDRQAEQLVERLRQLGRLGHLGERLAELGGLAGGLGVERQDDVDLALDRMLEILAADLLAADLHAIGDDHHPRLRRVGLEPGQDADRVAGAGEGELDDDDDDMDVVEEMRELHHHVARQVDHRALEGVADLLLQLIEGRAVGQHRLVDRRLGGEDAKLLVRPHHRALDEQAVDAARILDRVGEAAAGLEVERERAGAEMDVEVEQGGRAAALVAHQPGQRGGDGRGADAAADADHRRHDVGLLARRLDHPRAGNGHLRIGEGVAQLVGGERLQQIVLDAAGDEVAIEADVVDLAGGDHHRARLADFGERVDVVERVARFAEVDEQDRSGWPRPTATGPRCAARPC